MNEENDRNATIKAIKAALQRRSGKAWSVTGGRGTAWGWITINAPPARRTWGYRLKEGCADLPDNYEGYDTGQPGRDMTPADREELATLLGLDRQMVHNQGDNVPASMAHYREYLQRARGETVTEVAEAYWD